jgi:hypothetical protein
MQLFRELTIGLAKFVGGRAFGNAQEFIGVFAHKVLAGSGRWRSCARLIAIL